MVGATVGATVVAAGATSTVSTTIATALAIVTRSYNDGMVTEPVSERKSANNKLNVAPHVRLPT